jgi:hypothetical protein
MGYVFAFIEIDRYQTRLDISMIITFPLCCTIDLFTYL